MKGLQRRIFPDPLQVPFALLEDEFRGLPGEEDPLFFEREVQGVNHLGIVVLGDPNAEGRPGVFFESLKVSGAGIDDVVTPEHIGSGRERKGDIEVMRESDGDNQSSPGNAVDTGEAPGTQLIAQAAEGLAELFPTQDD